MYRARVMPNGWDQLPLIIADGSSEIYHPKGEGRTHTHAEGGKGNAVLECILKIQFI
jgi:hypothetical protein